MRAAATTTGTPTTAASNTPHADAPPQSAQPKAALHPPHIDVMPRPSALARNYSAPPRAPLSPPRAETSTELNTADRIVVVSNRLPDPTKPAAGGLAVALEEMPQETQILWFGWSGNKYDGLGPHSWQLQDPRHENTTFACMDLSHWQYDNYYAGFANSMLWPVFHEKVEYAELKPEFYEAYKEVNKKFASELAPMLKGDDVLWIHDYHLIPLAEELRAMGCKQRMGFFNHIPFPPPDVIKELPQHRELMKALFSYDLVGMQSAKDVENLRQYVEVEAQGARTDGPVVKGFGRSSSFKEFPIGIDAGKFESLKLSDPSKLLPRSQEILSEVSAEASRRRLMIGVDRLDYSKGIPTRLEAFREYLKQNPDVHGEVTFVQIAAPTRETVQAYKELKERTAALVNEINREFGTGSWKPVIYYNEPVEREALPKIYSLGAVGVVTPTADGMNLVAKEYVAAQALENPGVLVLSERAGAAPQLSAAVLVPPDDPPAIARAFKRAMTMPLDQRQRMHAPLLDNVTTQGLPGWRQSFLEHLDRVPTAADHGNTTPAASPPSSPNREAATEATGQVNIDMTQLGETTHEQVRSVYQASRLYHGTSDESKRSIRAHGFSSNRKVEGGSAAARSHHSAGFEGEDASAQSVSYHYLTAEKSRASRYALAAKTGGPSLVRTVGVRHDIPMERVMGVDRTSSDIPPQYVVGPKSSDPGPESSVFRQALERAGIQVSEQDAGRLLRDVQSDSESDFSSVTSDDER